MNVIKIWHSHEVEVRQNIIQIFQESVPEGLLNSVKRP
ncbi:hypothetical protein CHCC20375_1506 [Bacillus licheniformis]|nr:hypothetical protein CHCC20375_1506 [Bacillus licheniformis]